MNEMNDTNERQVTNTCTHTDDGKVCSACLGVESGGVDKMSEKPMEGDVIIKANTRVWCIFALTEDGEIESLGRLTDSVLRGDINISALERQMDALTAERDAAIQRAEQAEALAGILRAAGSEAVDTGVDLLEELARLRNLEVRFALYNIAAELKKLVDESEAK